MTKNSPVWDHLPLAVQKPTFSAWTWFFDALREPGGIEHLDDLSLRHALLEKMHHAQSDDDIEAACVAFVDWTNSTNHKVDGAKLALFAKALLIVDRAKAAAAIDAFLASNDLAENSPLHWLEQSVDVLRAAGNQDCFDNLIERASSSSQFSARLMAHAVTWMMRLYSVLGVRDCLDAWRCARLCHELSTLAADGRSWHWLQLRRRQVSFYTGVMLMDLSEIKGEVAWAADACTNFDACAPSPRAAAMRERAEFLQIRRHPRDAPQRVEAFAKQCRSVLARGDAYAWLIRIPTTDNESPISAHKRMEWFGAAMSAYEDIPDQLRDLRRARQAVALHAAASLGLQSAADDDFSSSQVYGAALHAEAKALAHSVNTQHLRRLFLPTERFHEYAWQCEFVATSEYKLDDQKMDAQNESQNSNGDNANEPNVGVETSLDWAQISDQEFSTICASAAAI